MSWATPILVKSGGRDELVTAGNQAIIGYDPATGRELWRMKGLASNAVPSPVAGDGIVVLSAGYPAKIAVAVRPGGSGDVTRDGSRAVEVRQGHGLRPLADPGGRPRLSRHGQGAVSCLDAKTGKVHYEGGRPPVGASYMASPVAVAGHLLLSSMDGDTVVLKAGTTHEIVRSNPLGEPIAASPAVVGGAHLHPRRAPPVRDRDAMRAARARSRCWRSRRRPLAATPDDLLDAVRRGDLAGVRAALDAGVPVDAPFRYERTALSFAADRGQPRDRPPAARPRRRPQ